MIILISSLNLMLLMLQDFFYFSAMVLGHTTSKNEGVDHKSGGQQSKVRWTIVKFIEWEYKALEGGGGPEAG